MILSKTLLTYPEMMYDHKILSVLDNMLLFLKNNKVSSEDIFNYYNRNTENKPIKNKRTQYD
jgi:hypothetical protein